MSHRDPIKVYDARWEAHEFTDAEVKRLFEATLLYGRELGVDTVTFCRDARLAAAHVMEIGIETAVAAGFRVLARTEQVSTPQSYFTTLWATVRHPKTMGLSITASHNPSPYIGVKFVVPPVHAIGADCGPKGGLTRIRSIYHSNAKLEPSGTGDLELLDLSREYIDFSLHHAGIAPGELRGLRVVLDAFHGSAGPEIYRALRLAGAEVLPLRLVPDGSFPTGSPNPTSQNKMNAAVELAKVERCHAVIGIDGDGDRIVFGDARGILTAGFAFVPILRTCMSASAANRSDAPPVLYDPKVSPLALAEWGKLGARPVLFRNGHSQIKDYMTQIGALAAAEESGHYYHQITLKDLTISGENSIMTILLFLGALAKDRTLMDQLWAEQEQVFTTGEFNYQFPSDAVRDKALDAVVRKFVGEGAGIVTATPDGIDLQGTCLSKGVRLDPGAVKLDGGWYSGYLRIATNEKGVVRSYFSAGDTPSGKRVETAARQTLENEFGGKVID
jgi:phosphomannomutase